MTVTGMTSKEMKLRQLACLSFVYGGSHHQRTSQSSHYTHGLASGGRCSGIEEAKLYLDAARNKSEPVGS